MKDSISESFPTQRLLQVSQIPELVRAIRLRVLHKIAKVCHPSALRIALHRLRGVEIGKGVFIGEGVHFDDTAPELIKLSDGVRIAAFTVILTHKRDICNHYKKGMKAVDVPKKYAEVFLEEDVQIGTRAIIMPGVKIGKGSIVGAGAVVCKDIPEYSLVVGVPAEIVKTFED